MRIELYVVRNIIDKLSAERAKLDYEEDYNFGEIEQIKQLEEIKKRLCLEYGGLTVIPSCTGYWLDSENLVKDSVEIWVILTKSKDEYALIESYAKEICKITEQKAQLFTIDNEPYLI